MALAQEDVEFIKSHLGVWLAEQSLGRPPVVCEIELRERMVRVEERSTSLSPEFVSLSSLIAGIHGTFHEPAA